MSYTPVARKRVVRKTTNSGWEDSSEDNSGWEDQSREEGNSEEESSEGEEAEPREMVINEDVDNQIRSRALRKRLHSLTHENKKRMQANRH